MDLIVHTNKDTTRYTEVGRKCEWALSISGTSQSRRKAALLAIVSWVMGFFPGYSRATINVKQ